MVNFFKNKIKSVSFNNTFFYLDEYVREKPRKNKVKKRTKKRPQSASITIDTNSV